MRPAQSPQISSAPINSRAQVSGSRRKKSAPMIDEARAVRREVGRATR
jgi:hypothetical protein